MSDLVISKTVFLKAPPDHVWRFLTEKDKLALWFYAGESDLKDGSEYRLNTNSLGKEGDRICWGRVIEFDPPKRLVHTFTHNYLEEVETTCIWDLKAVEGGTVLHLRHGGWENFTADPFGMGANHDKGWDEFFGRLRFVTS